MATHFATIWRADAPLARCVTCGVQRQFHGLNIVPINQYDRPRDHDFVAETVDDIDPAELTTGDLMRHCDQANQRRERLETGDTSPKDQREADALYQRVEGCRTELRARLRAAFGVSFDDLAVTLGEA